MGLLPATAAAHPEPGQWVGSQSGLSVSLRVVDNLDRFYVTDIVETCGENPPVAIDANGNGVNNERFFGAAPEANPINRHAHELDRVLATILFTDIVAATRRAADLGDAAWRELLEDHNVLVRDELRRWRGREVKATGDGFLATFDGPARAVRCAQTISHRARQLGVEIRAGVHTGECVTLGDDLGGIAVHIASRIAEDADAGQVLVSGTVKDLVVGSGLEFADAGSRKLPGVPGTWHLYSATDQSDID